MRDVYKRRLSDRAAARCAAAVRKACICRCGGVLHGAAHQKYQELERKALEGKETLTKEEILGLVQQANA